MGEADRARRGLERHLGAAPLIALDTHAALWLLSRPEKLSPAAFEAIDGARREREELVIASVALYELAQGIFRNRMQVHGGLAEFLGLIEGFFTVIPVSPLIAEAAAKMPDGFPRDPFDRIIAATALVHGAPLVTADGPIRRSGAVVTIW